MKTDKDIEDESLELARKLLIEFEDEEEILMGACMLLLSTLMASITDDEKSFNEYVKFTCVTLAKTAAEIRKSHEDK